LKETGGNYESMKKRCKKMNINTSHFTGQVWNQFGHPNYGNNIDISKRFVKHSKRISASKTKEVLLNHKLKEYKCEICGITTWNNKSITLQLHHINGDGTDDRLENLQLLCPNCHSQTDSFCKRLKIRKSTNLSALKETSEVEAG
jgi:5-methylcytosine-specific restriction endonuclease McrA